MRPSRVLALILVILVFPAGTVWAQQAIYGCVKNANGQVRIVSAGEGCLPSEHAIQWPASIPAQPSAVVPPPAVPPPPPPGPLRVVDQNGAALGVFVSTASGSNAARLAGDVWVALPLTSTGFQVTNPFDLMPFYQTIDCSGDAYLPVDTGNLLRTGFVMPGTTGQLAFSYPSKVEVDRTTIHAYSHYDGAAWVCAPFTPGLWMPLFGKMAAIDLSTFTGPFKIVQ